MYVRVCMRASMCAGMMRVCGHASDACCACVFVVHTSVLFYVCFGLCTCVCLYVSVLFMSLYFFFPFRDCRCVCLYECIAYMHACCVYFFTAFRFINFKPYKFVSYPLEKHRYYDSSDL